MAETRRPFQVRFSDPLSQVTRTERKVLLGVSTAALVLVQAGIVPTKIAALGIEFSTSDQRAIVRVAAFVIAYFLISFFIYAMNDYIAWNTELRGAMAEWMRGHFLDQDAEQRVKARADSPVKWTEDASLTTEEERQVRARRHVEQQMQHLAASPLNTRAVQVSASTTRIVWDFAFPLLFGAYATFATFQEANRTVTPPAQPAALVTPAPAPAPAPPPAPAPTPRPKATEPASPTTRAAEPEPAPAPERQP